MVHLTAAQLAAYAAVSTAFGGRPVLLVGAQALGCYVDMSYRATVDIDLVVSVDLDEFPGDLAALPGWAQDSKAQHRFRAPGKVLVDIIPAGPAQLATGTLSWATGHTMNLAGFDLAFAHARSEPTPTDAIVAVPEACVLLLLKMRAWLDRPGERARDLIDIAHLFHGYLTDNDERRFDPPLRGLSIDFDAQSAYLLGHELAARCNPSHRLHVDEFLSRVPAATLAGRGLDRWRNDLDHVDTVLEAFRQGFRRRC